MITLAEIKQYLGQGSGTDKDAFLSGIIPKASNYVAKYLGMNTLNETQFTDVIELSRITDRISLSNGPVISISELKYINGDNSETDIIASPDTIANTVRIFKNRITLYKGYSLYGDIKIVYSAGYEFNTLTGTVSTTSGSADVVGVGTAFTTELQAGDMVLIESELKQVSIITNDTNLTVGDSFQNTFLAKAIIKTTTPESLRQAVQIAYQMFRQSPQGGSTLLISSETTNDGVASNTVNFKTVNLSYIDEFKIPKYTGKIIPYRR